MNDSEIDWAHLRELVRAFIARRSRGSAVDDVEDLANATLEKLSRVLSLGPIDRPEAVVMTIARRTLIDYWRRLAVQRKHFEPSSERSDRIPDPGADPLEQLSDRRSEIRWVILTFLRKHAPKCHDLAVSYFSQEPWELLAQRSGKAAGALKREWHRCVERMNISAARNPRSILAELQP
jgi:DNA-directed RNA polymerase specialized sigma24 family protein